MTIERTDHAREEGMALAYVGIFLVPLLLCTGLAVDMGRGYLVRATLAKAVDAAALAAARNMAADSSQAKRVGTNIFNANFPAGYLGVTPDQPDIETSVSENGSYIIDVTSKATMPTTFMRIAKYDTLTVAAGAQATRRLVDMSFVIDRSGSLSGVFPQVKQAAKQFVSYFEPTSDRIALITFSSGTTVTDPMQAARGFDLSSIDSHIDSASPGGPTATAEALYEAWDQLRSVPPSSQSGLRIVVLFTDGSPNSFPGQFQVSLSRTGGTCSTATVGRPGTLCAIDYPNAANQTYTIGLYDTYAPGGTAVSPTNVDYQHPNVAYMSGAPWTDTTVNPCILSLPPRSYHDPSRYTSIGMPSSFPLYDPSLHQRILIQDTSGNYKDHPRNGYNAARNLAESIANAIRSDDTSGPSGIHIYTLGLGDLLLQNLGSRPETGSSILQRIANDPASSDFNPSQPQGRYFFAGDPAQLSAAFTAVRDEVVRLTQ